MRVELQGNPGISLFSRLLFLSCRKTKSIGENTSNKKGNVGSADPIPPAQKNAHFVETGASAECDSRLPPPVQKYANLAATWSVPILEPTSSSDQGLYGQLDADGRKKLDEIQKEQEKAAIHGFKTFQGPGKLSEDKNFKDLLNENYIVNIYHLPTELLKINDH